MIVRDWLLITGRGGYKTGRGGHVKFYPYEKGGHKKFPLFKRGGAKSFTLS